MWQPSLIKGVCNMKYNGLEPLTKEEKVLATESHSLVYSFLHRHNYAIEDFYNVVILEYLRSVQVYNRRKELQEQYPLAFISEQYMRAGIANYFRKESTMKRKPTEAVLSLDADYAETENLYNISGGKSAEEEVLEEERLTELLEQFSTQQKDILKLKLEGYNNKEIYLLLEIPSSTFYLELNRIKKVLVNDEGGMEP